MSIAIVWFRQDLRLRDNPALLAAVRAHEQVLPVYIHDTSASAPWQTGAAAGWWLHHSLKGLEAELGKYGVRLVIRQGDTLTTLQTLLAEGKASHLYWNRRYEPASIAVDQTIKQALSVLGIGVHSHCANLLFEPWEILKADGQAYRVFTPFWKACLKRGLERPLYPAPPRLKGLPLPSLAIEQLGLLPSHTWADGLGEYWQPGEQGAQQALDDFLERGLEDYAQGRERPDKTGTSRLSAHLHLGEISPARLIYAALESGRLPGRQRHIEAWLRELGWREFAHHLLYHFPATTQAPFDGRYAAFRWESDRQALHAWQRGETGIPIVDAGMRELWHTGWMHNRVRMIVASLLCKNLLIPWQEGARWFWDTLVDADLAANTLGWQWTAGCGADAAPWFRIFNPVLQGQKFDPQGRYVRRWVPTLAALPNKYLHQPWQLPETTLSRHGIVLGRDYPRPIIDLAWSRQRALTRFDEIKRA